jgi:hypothetical protein
MDNFESEIDELNQKLIAVIDSQLELGLMAGKMGYCIYFYKMAAFTNNRQYEKTAGFLLDSICNNVRLLRICDIENGLSGIALGLNFLIKEKLIKGNINKILSEFDVILAKALLFPDKNKPIDTWLRIQLLYYYSTRIKDQKIGSNGELVFKELIFKILNSFTLLPDNFFEEPYSFSIDFRLPCFIYILGIVSKIEAFRSKVKKLADENALRIISLIPVLHSHKIYLALGMSLLAEEFDLFAWKKHIRLLKREIDIDYMFTNEFKSKNIFFKNGIIGIIFLLSIYNKMLKNEEKIIYDTEYVRDKIGTSETWKQLVNNKRFFKENSSLNGFCGISLLNTFYI